LRGFLIELLSQFVDDFLPEKSVVDGVLDQLVGLLGFQDLVDLALSFQGSQSRGSGLLSGKNEGGVVVFVGAGKDGKEPLTLKRGEGRRSVRRSSSTVASACTLRAFSVSSPPRGCESGALMTKFSPLVVLRLRKSDSGLGLLIVRVL
jgi:hypothetical protein